MANVEFIYETIPYKIQCNKEDKMSEIIFKFGKKSKLDLNTLYFVSEGQILQKELKFSEITKNDYLKVLAYKLNETQTKLANSKQNKSNFIICPICKENSILIYENEKINLSDCRNGHILNYILINEFNETQKYDTSLIKCQICKNNSKSKTAYNEFYKCLNCEIFLCPLCNMIHNKKHNIINIDKNFVCSIHKEPYSLYCINCNTNSCLQCLNEKHKNHKNIFFGDMIPNVDEIKKKIKKFKESISLFKENIEEIKSKLNLIVNNFEILYKINEEIINNYRSKERNYEILANVKLINNTCDNVINKLNDINDDKNIINKINKIFNIYKVMTNKEEINDELIMKYHVSKCDKKIFIFGAEFVKRNKYLCKIIHENKEYELTSTFDVENCNKDYIKIKLKGLNYITDMSYMFYNCFSLLSVENKSNYNFENMTNMNSAFFGCTLLESLDTFKEIDTSKVTNMSFLFSLCNKLDLSFIQNWDTNNVTDMSCMFLGCYNLEEVESLNLNTQNVINMDGMFSGCLSLKGVVNLDFKNVLNMSQIFSGCKSLDYAIHPYNNWYFPNVKDISGMFSNCNSLLVFVKEEFSVKFLNNVINMSYLFSHIDNFSDFENFEINLSNLIDISNFFHGCKYLTSISGLKINSPNIKYLNGIFEDCSSLRDISAISNWNTKNVINIEKIFKSCTKLSMIPELNWDTSNVINMSRIFEGCSSLKDISGISNINTKKVKYLNNLFYKCTNLISIPKMNWDTTNVIDMREAFSECTLLKDISGISNFNTINLKFVNLMFYGCINLIELPLLNWNTINILNMSGLFGQCKELNSIKGISKWNTINVRSMHSMFFECEKLSSLNGLQSWNTHKVNCMSRMFKGCNNLSDLTPLKNWNTGNVIDMSSMFSDCKISSLLPISNWDTKNVINMSYMFSELNLIDSYRKNCPNILQDGNFLTFTGIGIYYLISDYNYISDLSGLEKWDTSNVENMSYMFSKCKKISSLSPISNWNTKKADINGIFNECKDDLKIPPNFNKEGYDVRKSDGSTRPI